MVWALSMLVRPGSDLFAAVLHEAIHAVQRKIDSNVENEIVSARRIKPCWLKAAVATLLLAFCANAAAQNRAAWEKLSAKEDNFSVLIPVTPEIRSRREFTFGPDGEGVNEERIASAYYNGVVYIVRMYETSNPKRLFSKYPEIFRLSNADASTITVSGIAGKQFLKKADGYFHLIRLFPAKKHLYVLEAAARAEANPDVQRFLSSLTLGDLSAGDVNSPSDAKAMLSTNDTVMPLAPADTKPLTAKQVTRPAVKIYNPSPPYTPLARQSRQSGSVKLRVVLSPSGEVTGVEVVERLGGGLTEAATEIVKSMKFLPAEKDGQLVPQYAEVEYVYKIF
jgi:TonB family protein